MANWNWPYTPSDPVTGMWLAANGTYFPSWRPAPPVVYGIDEPLERISKEQEACRYCGQRRREDERGGCAACGGPLR